MVYLFSILIFVSPLIAQGELSGSEVTDGTSQDVVDSGQQNTCANIENQFQNHLVTVMDGAIDTFDKSYKCLSGAVSTNSNCTELNSKNIGSLKNYRVSLEKLYQEIADNWVEEESKKNDGYTKNCLGVPVQFENNIRRVKSKLDYHICQPVLTSWSHGLDQLVREYLEGKREIKTLSTQEVQDLKDFHHSPLKRILSTDALFNKRLKDDELKQKLASAYNSMKFGAEKLRDKISKLEDHQRYILFDFQNQFTSFTNTLPPTHKRSAERCIANSSFFRDCTINIRTQGSRCGSRVWGFAKELMPIIPIIDSINGLGEVMAAEASGVMTSSEATAKRASLTTNAVLGIGGFTAGAASLAKPIIRSSLRRGGSSAVETAVDNSRALLKPISHPSSISRRKLLKAHNSEVNQLNRLGVEFSELPDVEGYAVDLARRGSMKADGFNPAAPPVNNVLRIRRGASKGGRHNRPRGLALQHKDIDARIKEAEAMGIRVVVDTSIKNTGAGAYYWGYKRVLAIRPNSTWQTFEHEFQHALFDAHLRKNFQSLGHSVRIASRSGQPNNQIRQQLPAEVRRHWSEKEQDVIVQYMREDLPELALNERLSVNRELEMLGWRRYMPIAQLQSNYATRHLVNELNNAGALTARQNTIRRQGYAAHVAQNAYGFGSLAAGAGAAEIVIIRDLMQGQENSYLLNVPRHVRSAIQSAKEVFYSEKGILVKDHSGRTQFFPKSN